MKKYINFFIFFLLIFYFYVQISGAKKNITITRSDKKGPVINNKGIDNSNNELNLMLVIINITN